MTAKFLECLLRMCPLLFLMALQVVTALAMILAVSGIALGGGCVIWLFYQLFG